MPETPKYKTESPKQGYPAAANDKDVLKADLEKLLTIYKDDAKRTDPDVIKELEVGKLCGALHAPVKQKVIDMCAKSEGGVYKLFENYKMWKNKPKAPPTVGAKGEVQIGDVTFSMGPLKKVPRIAQKAVTYAVCDEQDVADPRLERVVDILRGTLVFENEAFLLMNPKDGTRPIASQLIDAFNAEFGGQLVQVKNRFMIRRQPFLHTFFEQNFAETLEKPKEHEPVVVDDEKDEVADLHLVNTIATMVNLELRGRDTFYRDLQLLIKLPAKEYGVGSPLTHVFFELQITTRSLVDAKSGPSTDTVSGHKKYEQIRRVMEYCEYLYWTWKKKKETKNPKFEYQMPKKNDTYKALFYEVFPPPLRLDFEPFEKTLVSMWNQYQEKSPKGAQLMGIKNAIDNSVWYKGK